MEYTNKNPQLNKWRAKYPIWVQMLVVLSLLLPIVLVHNYYFYQVLPKMASSYLEALQRGEYSKAFYSFTTENFKVKTSLVQFKEFIKKHPVNASSFQVERMEPLNGVLDVRLGDQRVAFRFQRSGYNWKIAQIGVDGDFLPFEDRMREMVRAIEGQLSFIKNGEVADAYYTYMSLEFQEKNSLGSFQEMVEFFTPLKNPEKMEWLGSEETDGVLQCKISLDGSEGEYTLCREKGLWKIEAFGFGNREDREPKGLIQSYLQAIRSHELAKAYFDFTSKKFQKSMSLQEFKTFLKKHELFFHYRGLQLQTKTEATLLATLCSFDDKQLPVEFGLIDERGIWKINQIKMN